MNRRTFLHRAALVLGGALLAPLVGTAAKEAEAADEPLLLWDAIDAADDDYSMDDFVADIERAQANYAAVATFLPAEWNHATLADETWVKAFDPADIERAFAESVETWDFPTTTGDAVVGWGDTIHVPHEAGDA
jgi:hypothetical protein